MIRVVADIGGKPLTLEVAGPVLLAARRALRATPGRDASEEVGIILLALAIPSTSAAAWSAYVAHGGLSTGLAGQCLDLLVPHALTLAGALALGAEMSMAALAATSESTPALASPPAATVAPDPDPYPGLTLDTGAGPEAWPAFAARTATTRLRPDVALLYARWRRVAEAWSPPKGE